MAAVTSWVENRSVRTKVLLPVVVSAIGLSALSFYAVSALDTAGQRTETMYAHTARPLADLTSLRDAQGDSRVDVRDAILTAPGKDQEAVITDFDDVDGAVDQALDAYVADHGTLSTSAAALVAQARAGLAQWRDVRTNQLVPLVRANQPARAHALLTDDGALGKANSTFGDALDTLADAETAQAQSVSSAAGAAQRRSREILLIVALACALLAVIVGLFIARVVVRPVRRVQHVLSRLAAGDLTGDPQVTSRDEIGMMAAALVSANASLRQTVGAVVDSAQTLDDTAAQLQGSSAQIARQVTDSATQAGLVADAAGNASSSINTVTAGATEMSAAIGEIAQRASQAAAVAGEAVQAVATTSATVADLGQTSADIEQVLGVITSIAQQTNRRGQGTGVADRLGHRGHRPAGRRHPDLEHGGNRGDRPHRRGHQRNQRPPGCHRGRGRGADRHHRRDAAQRRRRGRRQHPHCQHDHRCRGRRTRHRGRGAGVAEGDLDGHRHGP
jgi:methyl-accepting chemotaxis protein